MFNTINIENNVENIYVIIESIYKRIINDW